MKVHQIRYTDIVTSSLIAPCGMNCALCIAYLREKKPCNGCNGNDNNKPKHCVICRIKNCEKRKEARSKHCYACESFPCSRLKQLDKRYKTKYGMSMVENLATIKEKGIRHFIKQEKQKWKCSDCGAIICVHSKTCLYCDREKK